MEYYTLTFRCLPIHISAFITSDSKNRHESRENYCNFRIVRQRSQRLLKRTTAFRAVATGGVVWVSHPNPQSVVQATLVRKFGIWGFISQASAIL